MISLDASAFFALIFAAALGGLLIGVLPPWRRLMTGEGLPVRGFLRRAPAAPGESALIEAELRCGLCSEKAGCARRLAGGEPPPEACPNRSLLRTAA